jgi:hypothetical protein
VVSPLNGVKIVLPTVVLVAHIPAFYKNSGIESPEKLAVLDACFHPSRLAYRNKPALTAVHRR